MAARSAHEHVPSPNVRSNTATDCRLIEHTSLPSKSPSELLGVAHMEGTLTPQVLLIMERTSASLEQYRPPEPSTSPCHQPPSTAESTRSRPACSSSIAWSQRSPQQKRTNGNSSPCAKTAEPKEVRTDLYCGALASVLTTESLDALRTDRSKLRGPKHAQRAAGAAPAAGSIQQQQRSLPPPSPLPPAASQPIDNSTSLLECAPPAAEPSAEDCSVPSASHLQQYVGRGDHGLSGSLQSNNLPIWLRVQEVLAEWFGPGAQWSCSSAFNAFACLHVNDGGGTHAVRVGTPVAHAVSRRSLVRSEGNGERSDEYRGAAAEG